MSTQTYLDLRPLPGPTGSQIQRQIAALKARLIARYRLAQVSDARPEELRNTDDTRRVSIGYGSGTIRIRQHGGKGMRTWTDSIDIQIEDGWHSGVFDYLDGYFGVLRTETPVVANYDTPPPHGGPVTPAELASINTEARKRARTQSRDPLLGNGDSPYFS